MDLREMYGFEELTNEAERLVLDELGRILEERGDSLYTDEDAILDIAAYALNHVAPMYRVNLLGRLYASTLSDEHAAEIRRAVEEAIEKVTKS
jgi:competence protein ComFB